MTDSLQEFLDSAVAVPNRETTATLTSIFAVDVTPERRRVVEISGEPGAYKIKSVNDYNTLNSLSGEIRQMSDELAGVKKVGSDLAAEVAIPPLTQAWRGMVAFLTENPDIDSASIVPILTQITALMEDVAEGNTYTCPQCSRSFASQGGLVAHLKNLHDSREKQTSMKTEND